MYSNLFSTINNGYLSKKNIIFVKNSIKNLKILNILLKENLILKYNINLNKIQVFLKYKNNKAVLNKIKQISKPSKRVYIKNNFILKNKQKGIFLISTSQGIYTNIQLKKKLQGGELICHIY